MSNNPEIPNTDDSTRPSFQFPEVQLEPPQTSESSSPPDSPPTVIEMAKGNTPNQGTTPTPDTPPRIPKTQEQLKEALRQRAQILFKSIEGKLDKLKEREKAGEFNDKQGETKGSGEARLKQAQDEIERNVDSLKQMKALLDSGANLLQEELVPQNIDDFFTPALSIFGTPKNGFVGTYVDPRTQDYAILKDDKEPTKFGDYTLNPDTQNIDFEHIPEDEIFIPDLSAFNGRPIHEVMQHIAQTYPNYKFPGLEYWEWLIKNPNKAPNKLKDTKLWFHFLGSLVRGSNGAWSVPYVYWKGAGWGRSAAWLSSSWHSHCRIVLLEI